MTGRYKIIFHFDNPNNFLEGFYVEKTATSCISAFEEVLKYENYITSWKGKIVCVNFKNFAYAECEEIKNDR